MGKIVPFSSSAKRNIKDENGGEINDLISQAVSMQKEVFGEVRNGIFCLRGSFREMMSAKICSLLFKKKMVRTELFQCSLYLAHMMEDFMNIVPTSYYATDYFIKGFKEKNPLILKDGADYCALLCIFFEGRRNWRSMKPGDYEVLGSSLYHAYYDMTQKPVGWYMAKNFKQMIPIARRSIESLRN